MKLFQCSQPWFPPAPFFDKVFLTEKSSFSAPLVFIAGVLLWFLSHPYWGIWHDARVYTLAALHWLHPDAFARDPWFMFGSQDSYTIFSPVYAGLISLMGVEKAALWGTLAEGLLYVFSCWILCRALPLKGGKYLVFLLLVSTQMVYCVNSLGYFFDLRISEPFITSRNLSVALSLLSLNAAFNGRKICVFFLTFCAIAFHPLMGGWMLLLLLVWFLNLSSRMVWLLCVLGVYFIGGLAFSNTGIFSTMSVDWIQYVHKTSGIVFADVERQEHLGFYIAVYALLQFAGRFGTSKLRQWYKWVLAISFSATLLFWFCSTYAPVTLIMQLQLWRANWLVLIFAVIAVVDLAKRAWIGAKPRRLIFVSTGTIFLFNPLGAFPILLICGTFPAQALRLSHFVLHRYHQRFWQGLKVVWLTLLAVWSAYIFWVAGLIGRSFLTSGIEEESVNQTIRFISDISTRDILLGIGFTGGNGFVALTVWMLLATRYRTLTVIGVLILTLISTPLSWDVRASRVRKLDHQNYQQFKLLIKPGDTIYWQQRPLAVYFSLRTACYVSKISGVGIIFSEEKTREVIRRLQRVALSGANGKLIFSSLSARDKAIAAHRHQKNGYFEPDALHTYGVDELSRPGLEYICDDTQLDYIIHETFFSDLALAKETDELSKKKTWYLYSCQDLRTIQKHKF